MHKANELLDTGCCLLFADCAGLTEQLLDVGDDARAFVLFVVEFRGHFAQCLSHERIIVPRVEQGCESLQAVGICLQAEMNIVGVLFGWCGRASRGSSSRERRRFRQRAGWRDPTGGISNQSNGVAAGPTGVMPT